MKPYYRRGSIAIYHGDARAVAPTLGPSDLVVTSPPYAEQRQYGFRRGGFDWARVVPAALASVNLAPRGQMLVNLGIVHREGDVVEYWAPLAPTLRSFGYRMFGWYVWDQGSGIPHDSSHGRFGAACEFVFHFNRQSAPLQKFVPCKAAGRTNAARAGQREKNNIARRRFSHAGRAIQPFKTLVAARELGRAAVGIDINERYCEIAARRLEADEARGEAAA